MPDLDGTMRVADMMQTSYIQQFSATMVPSKSVLITNYKAGWLNINICFFDWLIVMTFRLDVQYKVDYECDF